MADIDLERKQSVSWLWWVLGLLLVGLVAFLLADALADDDDVAMEEEVVAPVATEPLPEVEPADPTAAALPLPAQRFVENCAERQPAEMGLDHEYTSTCTQDLVAAISAFVPQNQISQLGLDMQMEEAREAAQQLSESGPDVTRHSQMTQNAFTSIASVVDELQNQRFPALENEAQALTEAAEGITASGDLLSQREGVQTFFARAGDLLQGMSVNPAATAI